MSGAARESHLESGSLSRARCGLDRRASCAAVEHEPPLLVVFDVANTWNGPESANLRKLARLHPILPTFELPIDKQWGSAWTTSIASWP